MKIPELLAPCGDFDCLVAAVQNGADAVYLGSSLFNARASATNFNDDTLEKAIDYAKVRGVKTHLTLNTLIKDDEFKDAIEIANKAYSYGIDAIIVQDLGLARYIINNFPGLCVHGSTQMTIHNLSGVLEAQKLGFSRVVLSREVPISEIKKIRENSQIEIEAFVHGALCISYSGQCLFSSIVGGRSGNRGKCAQACRLPYKLYQGSKKIEDGYLLSPKDMSGLSLLPEFIDAGIDSLKIEGRMKTPEYVATVVKIYRKYIDEFVKSGAYKVSDKDSNDLMQVFNRGSFSTGHLLSDPNKNFIYKEKSNNQGLYLGTVQSYAPITGHVKLKLETELSIGDTISISSETGNYTVSELMIKKQNISNAQIGDFVTIGRMKGNFSIGDKIYKMSSKQLSLSAEQTFSGKEIKKTPLSVALTLKQGEPITIKIDGKFHVEVSSDIVPQKAISSPITKERLTEQLLKTGNTPFEFTSINIDLESDLFVPGISKLNELRRNALEMYQAEIKKSYKRKPIDVVLPVLTPTNQNSGVKISVLLTVLDVNENYSYLNKVDNVYIPYSYFLSNPKLVHILCNNYSVGIYLPTIIKNELEDSYRENLNKIFNEFNVKSAVISNIGQLSYIPSKIYRIGNFSLNIFNAITISELKKLGFNRITLSPELNKNTLNQLSSLACLENELMVYGRLPLMTMQYCLLSHQNKCPANCPKMCKTSKYELKDRLGFVFKIVPDFSQTITTLYNSKITWLSHQEVKTDYIRISFLDETEEEKNKIINNIMSRKSFRRY